MMQAQPTAAARRSKVAQAAALAIAFSISILRAQAPLFLVDSTFDGLLTRVYSVDPESGAMALRADLGTRWTPVLGLAAASGRVLYLTGTDTSGADRCLGGRSCVLLRIELDPSSPVPLSESDLGAVHTATETVTEIVGLTFGSDGRLYASGQQTDALYVIDPETALAAKVGAFGIDIEGGDITTDDTDRLLLWNNPGDLAGLFDVNPATGAASVFELHPDIGLAGMAALGHSRRILGASPTADRLYEIDAVTGLQGPGAPLTADGARFDHKRGDLDSPYCSGDDVCEDGNLCTSNACSPGGCRTEPVDPDDGDACTVDTCDPAAGVAHRDLRLSDTDGDRVDDCTDRCPGTAAAQRVGVDGCSADQLCPCDGGWSTHGAYVSCVAAAVKRTGENGKRVHLAARSSCGAPAPLDSKSAPTRR